MSKGWLVLAAAGFLMMALSIVLPGRGRSPATGEAAAFAPAGEKLPASPMLPEFSLVDSEGQKLSRASLAGSTWIFDFIFTRCSGPCPMMTSRMAALQAAMAGEKRLKLVSITVDPDHDTPALLADYAKAAGAVKGRWLFVTGQQAEVFRLSRDGFKLAAGEGKAGDSKETMPLLHSTRLALVDSRARIRGYYDGTDAGAVRRLEADAKAVLAEETP